MNKPYELTPQEWDEIATVRAVRDAWGIDEEDNAVALLSDEVYAVRFDYQTDSPGYAGPLYLLQGGGAPETSPLALVRTQGRLEVVETRTD